MPHRYPSSVHRRSDASPPKPAGWHPHRADSGVDVLECSTPVRESPTVSVEESLTFVHGNMLFEASVPDGVKPGEVRFLTGILDDFRRFVMRFGYFRRNFGQVLEQTVPSVWRHRDSEGPVSLSAMTGLSQLQGTALPSVGHQLSIRLEGDQAEEAYGALNYRTAARTLFLRPYLAHFCSSFRRFFAVFSILTPGFQKVAPKDRGAAA
eukprot:COSAG04_NODE_971_length_9098_cov_6.273253_2_plen_208_part_00